MQTVFGLQQCREAAAGVSAMRCATVFFDFPCETFRWLALAVRLGRPHERSARRLCYVPKFVVFVWEIVGSAMFTVARLAMISRQLPAQPQSALSVS